MSVKLIRYYKKWEKDIWRDLLIILPIENTIFYTQQI